MNHGVDKGDRTLEVPEPQSGALTASPYPPSTASLSRASTILPNFKKIVNTFNEKTTPLISIKFTLNYNI
jgi:hypothetical protein